MKELQRTFLQKQDLLDMDIEVTSFVIWHTVFKPASFLRIDVPQAAGLYGAFLGGLLSVPVTTSTMRNTFLKHKSKGISARDAYKALAIGLSVPVAVFCGTAVGLRATGPRGPPLAYVSWPAPVSATVSQMLGIWLADCRCVRLVGAKVVATFELLASKIVRLGTVTETTPDQASCVSKDAAVTDAAERSGGAVDDGEVSENSTPAGQVDTNGEAAEKTKDA